MVALFTLLALPAGASLYRIDASISDDLQTIRGTVEIDFVNDWDRPITALTIWLYPNTFSETPPGIQAGNRDFYQPFGPGFGQASLEEIVLNGSETGAKQVILADVPDAAAWRLELPTPLQPGVSTNVSLRFMTKIPRRLGPLSVAHGVLTALGGWHPFLIAGDPEEVPPLQRRPRAADWEVHLQLPRGYLALAGGEFVGEGGVHLQGREWLDLVVRPSSVEPISSPHGTLWPLEPPPSPGDRDRTIPDPPPLPTAWVGDRLLDLLEKLDLWADQQGGLPDQGPATLVVVPLRSEMAIATPGILAISDRAYKVTPIPILLRFHGRAIARAYFMWRLLPLVRSREAPGLVPQIADALASMYADRFAEQVLDQSEDASGFFGVFDLIPSIDDFLRSAESAFAHVYFQPVADPIPVRDEPWTFNNGSPRGKLLHEKLSDLFGPFALPDVYRRYLEPLEGCGPPPRDPERHAPCSLRTLAESSSGEDLLSFFRAWTESFPKQDLRTRIASAERLSDGRSRSTVEVWRLGDRPPEVIEVAARDGAGTVFSLIWDAAEGEQSHLFEIFSERPIVSARVDPRNRVFQTPAEPGELAAVGDRDPARLQPTLATLSGAYSTVEKELFGDIEIMLRPSDAVRRRLGIGVSYQPAQLEVRTWLSAGFGELVGAARYTHNVGVGLVADFLQPGFAGGQAPSGYAVGPALSYTYDDRPDALAPLHGTALRAHLSPAIGANRGTESALFTNAGVTALRLFPLGYSQTLAVRLKGTVLVGDPPFQSLISLGGSDEALRAFSYEEVLGKRRAILSAEWRHRYAADLDIDLGFARIQEIGGALFVDGAAMGGIVRPHAVAPGPSSALFADVGYGLRFQYALFGVRPLNLALELSLPFGRTASTPQPSPLTFSLRAGQAFSNP